MSVVLDQSLGMLVGVIPTFSDVFHKHSSGEDRISGIVIYGDCACVEVE